MKFAALYDVHGNLPALEAVLAEVRSEGVDLVIVGGDVLPGPMPRECLEALLGLELPTRFIHGNGDREVLARMRGQETDTVPPAFREVMWWNASQLGPDHEVVLAGWPSTLMLDLPDVGRVLFCHATPRNDTEIFTRLTDAAALAPIFDATGAALVVCGHTHMAFDRVVGRTRVVNAGSVGMPFGAPGACWLLLTPDVDLRRTTYDLDAAAARIRATAYPHADAFASGNVLAPPSEDVILQAYAKAQLTA